MNRILFDHCRERQITHLISSCCYTSFKINTLGIPNRLVIFYFAEEIKFVPEKEKRDNYNKRLVLRRHILSELKIPLKGNTVDDEDNQFEDYPGKYRIFIHPGEEPETVTSETVTPLADRLPDIKENNAKTNSFQNIQKKLLPRLSEDTEGEDTGDNPLFSNLDSTETHPVFSLEREETSFDILAPLSKKKAHDKKGKCPIIKKWFYRSINHSLFVSHVWITISWNIVFRNVYCQNSKKMS